MKSLALWMLVAYAVVATAILLVAGNVFPINSVSVASQGVAPMPVVARVAKLPAPEVSLEVSQPHTMAVSTTTAVSNSTLKRGNAVAAKRTTRTPPDERKAPSTRPWIANRAGPIIETRILQHMTTRYKFVKPKEVAIVATHPIAGVSENHDARITPRRRNSTLATASKNERFSRAEEVIYEPGRSPRTSIVRIFQPGRKSSVEYDSSNGSVTYRPAGFRFRGGASSEDDDREYHPVPRNRNWNRRHYSP